MKVKLEIIEKFNIELQVPWYYVYQNGNCMTIESSQASAFSYIELIKASLINPVAPKLIHSEEISYEN